MCLDSDNVWKIFSLSALQCCNIKAEHWSTLSYSFRPITNNFTPSFDTAYSIEASNQLPGTVMHRCSPSPTQSMYPWRLTGYQERLFIPGEGQTAALPRGLPRGDPGAVLSAPDTRRLVVVQCCHQAARRRNTDAQHTAGGLLLPVEGNVHMITNRVL